MAIIVKGVFHVVYRQSGKVQYTLTDPPIVVLRGEIEDDCMGAFDVLTEMDGWDHVVTAVADDGTLTLREQTADEVFTVPEVGTVQEPCSGSMWTKAGALRG